MLGFTTSRTLDPSSGQDARGELNNALSRRMAELEKKKRMANQKEKLAVCDKLRDDVRTLHEAYQAGFLNAKHTIDNPILFWTQNPKISTLYINWN